MDLVQTLVSNLGINAEQAKGGAGLLFNVVKEKLSSGEFQQLADKIPGINDMMSAAPESEGGVMGALGGIASAIGGKAEGLGMLANLAGGFSKLGLDKDMVGKFVPVLMDFVQNQGGDQVKALIDKVIGQIQA